MICLTLALRRRVIILSLCLCVCVCVCVLQANDIFVNTQCKCFLDNAFEILTYEDVQF